MKKIIALVLVVAMSVCLFTACGSSTGSGSGASGEKEEKKGASWEIGEGTIKVWKSSLGPCNQIVVPVVNNGSTNLYLKTGKIDIEDASGTLVKSIDMVNVYPSIIQPGETAYYYDEQSLDGVEGEGLKIVPHFEIEESRRDCVRLDVSEVSIKDSEIGGVEITGRVQNNTSDKQSMVYVSVSLFDSEKNLIGHAIDIMTDGIAAGDKVGFTARTLVVPDDVKEANIASYEVIAYPLQMQF